MTDSFSDAPITLDNGIEGSVLKVVSANPLNFHQAISKPREMPEVEIYGQLFLPQGPKNLPVVIVVPGSLGVAPSHLLKAELLTAEGIAAFVIDPFGSRGVSSTVANQAQYSFAASAWDVLAAARVVSKVERVDRHRVGAQGHSRGGSAALMAACMAELPDVRVNADLCGVYAAYPWCGQQFRVPAIGATRVRAVIGDQDEWCLPQQVQGQVQAMRLTGGDATFRLFAGAHHGFDRETGVELIADASVSPGAPTVYVNDDGAFIHALSDEADSALTDRELMLYGIKAGYGRRGAQLGSSGDLAEQFHSDMLEFWRETFS